MGRFTEEFRALLDSIPRTPHGLTPEMAMRLIVQIANGSLQVIAQLEERLEDAERENAGLVERLIETEKPPQWTPPEV
jgi:hypothetical protein